MIEWLAGFLIGMWAGGRLRSRSERRDWASILKQLDGLKAEYAEAHERLVSSAELSARCAADSEARAERVLAVLRGLMEAVEMSPEVIENLIQKMTLN